MPIPALGLDPWYAEFTAMMEEYATYDGTKTQTFEPAIYSAGELTGGFIRNSQGVHINLDFIATQPSESRTVVGVSSNVTTNLFTSPTPHGLTEGAPIFLTGLSATTGVVNDQPYAVRTIPSSTTFGVALVGGGLVINLTGANDSGIITVHVIDSTPPASFPGTPHYGQGTPFLIEYNCEIDFEGMSIFGGGVALNSPYGIGIRAIAQIEGRQQNNGIAGGPPIALQTMLVTENKSGVAQRWNGGHHIIAQPWYISNSAVSTYWPPYDDSAEGAVTYYDNSIYLATGPGSQIDGMTHGYIPTSFRSNIRFIGNVHFPEYRMYECAPPNMDSGALVDRITGLYIPFLAGFNPVQGVGIENNSAYLAPYGFVQAIDNEMDQINPTQEHIAIAPTVSHRVLLSTPTILTPFKNGQRLRITNTHPNLNVTFSDESALVGSGIELPTASYTLRAGQTCEFVARTNTGPWILANAGIHERFQSLSVTAKDISVGRVDIFADAIGHQSIAGYANGFHTLPTWFVGEITSGYPDVGLYLAAPDSIADVKFFRIGTNAARIVGSAGITLDLSIFPSGIAGSAASSGNMIIASTTHSTKGMIVLQDETQFASGLTTVIGTASQGKIDLSATEFGVATPITLVEFYNIRSDTLPSMILGTVDGQAIIGSNTGTGVKIGQAASEKFGMYGATPVVQPAATGTSAGFTAGAGTTVTHLSTFTGGVGTKAYTLGDVILALKQLGSLATS